MLRRALNVLKCRFFGHPPPKAELARVLNAVVFFCPRCDARWLVSSAD